MKYFLPAVFLAVFLGSFLGLSKTQSFLSDEEKAGNNILSTATTFDTVTPTPTTEPIPTPIPTINPGDVVINEVYYDVGLGKGSETSPANDEWIELYNNTDQPINIKDWTITDNVSLRTIHANVDIPAYGFALIAKDANTWTYWSIPPGVEKVSLGEEIGNGSANGGDRLTLKDDMENVIDQMSYGSDTTFFILTPVNEGHSWERDPDGKDTDTAADFVDRSTPTPGS